VSVAAFPEIPAATEPAERRGRDRADVALLVARREDGELEHRRFDALPEVLRPGDLLVVNTSATLPAALPGRLGDEPVRAHLSTPLDGDRWVVELRAATSGKRTRPPLGARIALPAGASLVLEAPYRESERLAVARLRVPGPLMAYLGLYGAPIRYAGAPRRLADLQTVWALEPGSAEMPSAGRAFTPELVTACVARGIGVAPLVLHCGVSSLERMETPFPERFRVPPHTRRAVAATHAGGGRVIAVGTTVVRALETPHDEGWTDTVISPERRLAVVDGLLTGWHEPESSHLLMLEAAAGRELLERSYAEAAARGYAGHELGDLHLILP
jgi:S-adenosylmethionine:tRNA ribosyltransferase-isomerase